MEAKLKLILKQIPWSLVLKAAAFSLAWLFLPAWISFVLALYFYFWPFFHSRKLLFPFVLFLLFALGLPGTFWFAAVLGAIFFSILGIKNLIFVNRFGNHQFLAFLLFFLAELSFFFSVERWNDWRAPFLSLGTGLLFFFLTRQLLRYVEPPKEMGLPLGSPASLGAGIGSFLVWQLSLAILFLPLNPLYQTALLFLVTVILADFLLERARGRLDRRKLLTDFSIFFIIVSFILISAEWGL